ncbi:unnamed protein product [Phytophthora fragariaefolia]|uniref:Unnamed protein product n=1 Tax=Phytophthora fragariaefolia TaxID=1490495 RepID=A0A9W6XP40_9STRA|nr:unnamed protein product [Phytophthora fragariaefolia]
MALFHRNGRKLIENVLGQYHIASIQETKFRDAHHLSKFIFHVNSITHHRVFVSDRNSSSQVQLGPRSCGVATLLHPDLLGVESAQEVTSATIPGRYLLVHLMQANRPLYTLYIHNIYAPVRESERAIFYQKLPTHFEPIARHLVLGDFNVTIDPVMDSRGVSSVVDASRGVLLSWLAGLNVTDSWRHRYPRRRTFSGLLTRVNRLDYIFVSDDWVDTSLDDTKYFQAPHSGDHLAVRVNLGSPRRRPPPSGYWRLKLKTLEDESIRQSIMNDIQNLSSTTRDVPNPGLVWEDWKRPNGTESDDPADISDQFRRHWGDIFGDERFTSVEPPVNPEATRKLLDSITRRLSSADTARLEEPLSTAELAAAMRHLNRNSAPGLDGLGAALYQVDPDAFGVVLATAFQNQRERGCLLPSQRRSSVALLYKKGDPRDPSNYRPISHMQVDVKVISKALAYRLQRVLPLLIHPDQKGFVRGHSLHHHARFLQDLQDLLRRRGGAGYAFFLDFAKAYDRVNWDYLFQVLERVGCGPAFRSWVQLLYCKPEAVLALNGILLEVLCPSRGVKQGDPLSSLLFVLTIEPLRNLLRDLPDAGLPIAQSCNGTGLYFADDSTLLSGSLDGLRRQLDLVELYCAGSGALLILNKSQLVAFHGNSIRAEDTPFGVASSGSVVYLGVPVGPKVSPDVVCASLEAKVCARLARWGSRARTYRGRLVILNAMVLSVLWHFTPHFNLPGAMVRRLQALIDQYVLTRRGDPGRRFVKLAKPSICHVPFNRGGLQIPRVEVTSQTQRVLLLQQFYYLVNSDPWLVVSDTLLQYVLSSGLHMSTFDFLDSPFSRRSKVIEFSSIPACWQFSWFVWSRLPRITSDSGFVDPVACQSNLLEANVCHSAHPQLQIELASGKPVSLLREAGRVRDFRLAFASETGYRSLSDFSSSSWPSAPEFLARFMLVVTTWNMRVRVRYLLSLYYDLSTLAQNVVGERGLLSDWSLFVERLTWDLVCIASRPKWLSPATSFASILHMFWMTTVSITLHVIWTTRNKHRFEDRPALDPISDIYKVYSAFAAHFRHWLRRTIHSVQVCIATMVSAITPKLFTPFKLAGNNAPVELKHRVAMAPLTRMRTGESGVPTALVAEHYAQRATDGGLLIVEATNISPTARGYFGAPGLFTQEQVDGWKLVTKAVHDKGGKIFVQLWHTGRVGHPLNQPDGQLPVSSSATSVEDITSHAVTREGRKDYVTPRALEIDEIPGIIADYKKAAENAVVAGFDGVEIHAANGYLLEQFLCDSVNKRTDAQVAIRLSPFGDTFGCKDSTPDEAYGYVVGKLNDYNLAYLHVIERRGMHAANVQVPKAGVTRHFRNTYKGVLVTAAGYDREDAIKTIEEGAADLVAFGRDFIANPDLVERLRIGAKFNTQDMKTFSPQPGTPLERGYTD